jgi:hypothetical protein
MGLIEKMERRAECFRQFATMSFITADMREAAMAAADLYEARAENMRSRIAC